MSGCGLSVSTTVLIILVICQMGQPSCYSAVVPISRMLLPSAWLPDNRNLQGDYLENECMQNWEGIKGNTVIFPFLHIYFQSIEGRETSLLAAHVSHQSRAGEETLRILHLAVKALNHLASVLSSYHCSAQPSLPSPQPSCLPFPSYISHTGVCFFACPSACPGHFHKISLIGVQFPVFTELITQYSQSFKIGHCLPLKPDLPPSTYNFLFSHCGAVFSFWCCFFAT